MLDRQPDGTDGVSLTDQTLITVSQGVNTSIQHNLLGTPHWRRHPASPLLPGAYRSLRTTARCFGWSCDLPDGGLSDPKRDPKDLPSAPPVLELARGPSRDPGGMQNHNPDSL